MKPHLYIIGGANGSGKTTAAMTLLPQYLDVYEFVNADEIARGLNPLKPDSANLLAGRVMIQRVNSLIEAQSNFAFETTCAGNHHAETIKRAKAAGYVTTLIFLWLPSADMAVQRVRGRVRQGGHDIPEATIRRRYAAGLTNLTKLFLPLVDKAVVYDNTTVTQSGFRKIVEKNENGLSVFDRSLWDGIANFSGGDET
ncbi:MAG: zeta toxin family protein [Alphaproteobacteria bacterium]|jgi:predicted ABC-type ATPase|nr:zeta toxin family protein [Alphaproteobacteria bacterium]